MFFTLHLLSGNARRMTYEPNLPDYHHQSLAKLKAKTHPNPAKVPDDVFAYLMEMGTGKTKCALDEWGERVAAGEIDDLLITAPAGVYRNWEGELEKHLPTELFERTIVVPWISGKGVTHKRKIVDMLATLDPRRPRVFLVNTEAAARVKEANEASRQFLQSRRCALFLDESTVIKEHKAKVSRVLHEFAGWNGYRRIMTGSPSTNSPLDLYSQFYFLDWRILGFRNFYAFRSRYAIIRRTSFGSGRDVDQIVGFQNLHELQPLIEPYSYRVLKKDCLDLPEKIYMPPRAVPLAPEQEKAYAQLKYLATAELGDGEFVTATEVITQMLRLHQILCGHTRTESGKDASIPSYRIKTLLEVLDPMEGKVIIWATYRYSLKEIADTLRLNFGPKSVVLYYGDTSAQGRVDSVEEFQNNPEVRYFVGNPSTGGRGITLTAADHVVYYSNSYSLEHREQSEDRAHRIGQHNPVTYTDLVAEGTVDERIIKALRQKINLATTVTGDNYREWLI